MRIDSAKQHLATSAEDARAPFISYDIADLFPALPDASMLLVGTGREDFMASRIAHAVEDAEAHLLNMNVTRLSDDENRHIIELRVSHRDPERVARSLERYGYNILNAKSSDGESNEVLTRRLEELMRYINI